MKMHIDPLVSVAAGGAPRATCALIAPNGKAPATVAHMAQGEGRNIQFIYTAEEAIALGQMLLTCGCIAAGGMPPELPPERPPVTELARLIVDGRKH